MIRQEHPSNGLLLIDLFAGEGLITYMRTDGVTLSPEATQGLREVVQQEYGRDYLPPQPRCDPLM
jgi:DNA topoisomerase IA